jgi:hypothetical protein
MVTRVLCATLPRSETRAPETHVRPTPSRPLFHALVAPALVIGVACSKPTPEELCARAPEIDRTTCVIALQDEQRRAPGEYQRDVACLTAATREAGAGDCLQAWKARARAQEVEALSAKLREQTEALSTLEPEVANARDEAQRAAAATRYYDVQRQRDATKLQLDKARDPDGGRKPVSRCGGKCCDCSPVDPTCTCRGQ